MRLGPQTFKMLEDIPRIVIQRGKIIIANGDGCDVAHFLISGSAKCQRSRDLYEAHDLLSPLEFLAYETYRSRVIAMNECRIISCSKPMFRNLLDAENNLTWPLSRQIASDIVIRRGHNLEYC
ncbi:MAG: hypothetical protein CML73_02205 [Rhodobiaceae bacterium]|nr:hypothetical protein [Rhodobiaceae bacterium]